MDFSWGFSQFGEESPPPLTTWKYSCGNMIYLDATFPSLAESEGLFKLHRAHSQGSEFC